MSYVTNVILSYSIIEKDEKIEEINKFFEKDTAPFVSVDSPELPHGWYGGTKMLETPLFIGAFNHLRLDQLMHHIAQIEFEEPQSVQLIVKDQEDDVFKILYPFTPSHNGD